MRNPHSRKNQVPYGEKTFLTSSFSSLDHSADKHLVPFRTLWIPILISWSLRRMIKLKLKLGLFEFLLSFVTMTRNPTHDDERDEMDLRFKGSAEWACYAGW